MQIDSMKISRKTWITEEIQAGPQKILKIAKGTAIISERYIQEAQIIASELGKPINIEKNTISKKQEKTLLTETNTVDQSEITFTDTTGYKEEERNSIEETIAQISVVFWIKNKNELSRIQISPEVAWEITSNYEDKKGEWQQDMENGWTSFIPGGAIISKPIKIFGKTNRIGERSCITKANFTTKSTMTTDIINLTQINDTTITEKCRIGNRQIASKAMVSGNSQIDLPLECSISSPIIRCGRVKYLFENEEINQARIRRVSVTVIKQIEKKENPNTRIEYIIIALAISIGLIIIAIIAIKKYLTSTPKNSRSQSPESTVEEIEMDEMGRFRCLRRQGDSSEEREKYSIYNSYNSLDSSWRLDRINGENRSLNETDVRRALIDSKFHQDEESARNCCYSTSNFTQENHSERTHDLEAGPSSAEACSIPQPNRKIKKQAPARPGGNEVTTNSEEELQNSLDASWCLDRSDGTNRSLNQSEIEEKQPTAPHQIYPPLPFNPYFETSPPPIPPNTPPHWNNTPMLGELMEIERQQELEEGAIYNHEL